MATLLKVLNNLADIKSAGGVALRVRTQARRGQPGASGVGGDCSVDGSSTRRAVGDVRRRRRSGDRGAGVGANLLVGGSGRAFSLQPISVQGQTGLNVAGGVITVTLLPPPLPPSK
jgi:hypothetical protein